MNAFIIVLIVLFFIILLIIGVVLFLRTPTVPAPPVPIPPPSNVNGVNVSSFQFNQRNVGTGTLNQIPPKKNLLDQCSSNDECASGQCILTSANRSGICGYEGECQQDYSSGLVSPYMCPSDLPYCLRNEVGITSCSASRTPSFRGSVSSSTAYCRQGGEDLYCVDSRCTSRKAGIGERACDASSCETGLVLDSSVFGFSVCSVPRQNITSPSSVAITSPGTIISGTLSTTQNSSCGNHLTDCSKAKDPSCPILQPYPRI